MIKMMIKIIKICSKYVLKWSINDVNFFLHSASPTGETKQVQLTE